MNSFNDFVVKYFDITYMIPQFSEKKLLELINKIIEDTLKQESFSAERSSYIDKQIRKENTIIINNLKDELKTIRQVKLFERVFKYNVNRFKVDIYFPDIITISLIEASDYELFNYIRSNYEKFSAFPISQLRESLFWGYSELKSYKENINELINPIKHKRSLIDFLFPHIKYILDFQLGEPTDRYNISNFTNGYTQIYNEIEHNNRLTLDILLFRLFTNTSVDKSIELITSQDLKDQLVKSFSQQNFDLPKSRELLSNLFPSGDQNFHLRRNSLGWVYDQISNSELHISYNFVLVLSFIAKDLSDKSYGLFGLDEKKQAAYQVWHYLERKNSEMHILIDILRYWDNSDEFADNILFYSINIDRTPRNVRVPMEIQKMVVVEYLKRLNKKLKQSGSIFNTSYFDASLSTIWRWFNAIKYAKKNNLEINLEFDLRNHILQVLKSDINAFETFFNGYIIQDYEDEPARFNPESVFELITISDLIELIKQYISEDRFNKLPVRFYQSMTEWLKINDKSTNDDEE